ncbi:hypothetical protein BDR22DRAFT_977193 [Usnea florida]
MDPVSASFTSGIGATLKILEVLYQIQATDEQTSDILNTANHVDRNLNEAQRLLEMKASFIDHKDKEWVISTIQDIREALKSISKLIEPARVEKMTKNDIGILAKTFWAFKYNPQARDKQAKLVICHQTLMVVISRLHSINIPTVSEAPHSESLPLPPPYDQNMEKLWAWQDHRNSRKKSTMSLRNDFQRGPVVLATNQRQATEGPPQTLHSYSTTNYMMDSRRGHLAQDIRNYNTSYHPNHSHNEAFGQSPHHLSSTAPSSRDEWIYGSQTNIILQRSEARLPRANTTSPYPIHAPHGHSPAAEDDTSPYEMSAAQTSPPERQLPSHLITHELAATPRKPIGHPMIKLSSDSLTCNSDYNNGMSIHQPFSNSATRSNLTSPSWSSLVSVKEPHHPPTNAGYESAEQPDFSLHPLNVLDNHSELEAEAVQGDAVVADAGTSEKSSSTHMWASGDDPCSISSPDLTDSRPGVGGGARNTKDRDIAAGGTRRRTWLGYQSSLRNSRHGREGIGGI